MEKDHREIIFVVASPLKKHYPSTENPFSLWMFFFSFCLALKTPHEILPLNSHLEIVVGEKAQRPPGVTLSSPPLIVQHGQWNDFDAWACCTVTWIWITLHYKKKQTGISDIAVRCYYFLSLLSSEITINLIIKLSFHNLTGLPLFH